MLTDEEKESLREWARVDEFTDDWGEPLYAIVESMIASRVCAARAQELRDTAEAMPNVVIGAQWLRDRANDIESSQHG